MRWRAPDLAAIDAFWRITQVDQPTHTEAIRRLVRLGLAVKRKEGQSGGKSVGSK